MSADTVVEPIPLDDFGTQARERYVGNVQEYNALVATIKAASGSPEEVLEAVMQDTSNPDIEKRNMAIEKHKEAVAKLTQEVKEIAQPIADAKIAAGSSNVEAEIAKADALHKTIRAARTYLTDSYGEHVLDGTLDVARRANRSSGGEGGKRIRGFDVHVDGKLALMRDGKGVERSNFAAGAKAAGVDTVTLQKAFYVAAGTEDSKKFPNRVEFEITSGEGDEAVAHKVVAVRLTEEETPAKDVPADEA